MRRAKATQGRVGLDQSVTFTTFVTPRSRDWDPLNEKETLPAEYPTRNRTDEQPNAIQRGPCATAGSFRRSSVAFDGMKPVWSPSARTPGRDAPAEVLTSSSAAPGDRTQILSADFIQELPRKLLPTRANENQSGSANWRHLLPLETRAGEQLPQRWHQVT